MKKLFSLLILLTYALVLLPGVKAEINEGVYPNNVDDPSTVIEIQAELTVFDYLDGDLTENIYVVLDNYTGHETELGDFIIVFGVVDSGGNIVTFAVTVHNMDITPPEFIVGILTIPQHSNISLNLIFL